MLLSDFSKNKPDGSLQTMIAMPAKKRRKRTAEKEISTTMTMKLSVKRGINLAWDLRRKSLLAFTFLTIRTMLTAFGKCWKIYPLFGKAALSIVT